jgi:hypothetical protein
MSLPFGISHFKNPATAAEGAALPLLSEPAELQVLAPAPDRRKRSAPRPTGVITVLLVALVSLPFFLGAAQIIRDAQDPYFTWGDDAFIDMSVHRATEGDQLLGAYSRFGWNHPGPLMFYLLAPFYWLLDSPIRIFLGALMVNWGFALATAGIAIRRLGARSATLVVLGIAVLVCSVGPEFMRNPWNPSIVVFPLMLGLVAVAVRPSVVSLTAMVLAASMALQSHIGTLTPVAVIVSLAAVLWLAGLKMPQARWLSMRRVRPERRRIAYALAAGSIGLAWLPVILQQLLDLENGNLVRMAAFADEAGSSQRTLAESSDALVGAMWLPWSPLLSLPPSPPVSGLWLVAGLTVLAVGCAFVAWRQRQRPAFVFSAFAAAALPSTLIAISHITGDLQVYLLWWMGLISVSLGLGLLMLVFGDRGVIRRWPNNLQIAGHSALAVCAGVAAFMLYDTTLSAPLMSEQSKVEVEQLWTIVEPQLPAGSSVYLDLGDADVRPYVAGLAVELERAGHDWEVAPDQRTTFGKRSNSGTTPTTVTVSVTFAGSGKDLLDTRPAMTTESGDVFMAVRVFPERRS